MKKLFALLFVCAGLTAMAAAPLQLSKADVTKKATTAEVSKVMKTNMLLDQLTTNVMNVKAEKNLMTPKKFFRDNNLTPADNSIAKRAPRRLAAADLESFKYVDFTYHFSFDSDGHLKESDPYYVGGNGFGIELDNADAYAYGLYWNALGSCKYMNLEFDFDNNTVSLPLGVEVDDSTYSGTATQSGRFWNRVDTVLWGMMVNEYYFYQEAEYSDPVTGTIYPDGSIMFNDSIGYAYYGYYALVNYQAQSKNGPWTMVSSDTTTVIDIYRGSQFLVANGRHDFKFYNAQYYPNGINTDADVYMFQDAMGTISVFNLWGYGMPDCSMYVEENGVLEFPDQPIYDFPDDYAQDDNGNMQGDGVWYNTTGTWASGNVSGLESWGNVGTITENAAEWGMTVPYNNHWVWGTAFGDNKLTYVDDTKFVVEMAAAPTFATVEEPEFVTITANSADEGATILFLIDGVRVENPYAAERRDTAYTVVALAGAYVPYEKNLSTTQEEIIIPAIEDTYELGDVDHSGGVDIVDVTILINAVLGNETDIFYPENANCNGEGAIDIEDVTALINRVLSGSWE